jgi:hypothetical protein
MPIPSPNANSIAKCQFHRQKGTDMGRSCVKVGVSLEANFGITEEATTDP